MSTDYWDKCCMDIVVGKQIPFFYVQDLSCEKYGDIYDFMRFLSMQVQSMLLFQFFPFMDIRRRYSTSTNESCYPGKRFSPIPHYRL